MDSRMRIKASNMRGRAKPTIIGTGLLALDVVIADSFPAEPIVCAGGTCGNVLTALSFLNWEAYPIARLRADAASKRVTDDLKSWGVRLDFVTLDDEGSTPVVVQHIRRNKAGVPSHSFSRKCPQCGVWLPWYKAVRAADASEISTRLPAADVFYFDRTSRGAVSLAEDANERGCLVVFEPSSGSEPTLLADALAASHIVKIASARLTGNEGVLDAKTPLLLIETMGDVGLRFKLRTANGSGRWQKLPALDGGTVADTAGAGDWCTTGIISRLGLLGVAGLRNADRETVASALEFGQAMAAWSCQYNGARGGMYEVSKAECLKVVNQLLDGDVKPKRQIETRVQASVAQQPVWCDCCLVDSVR